MKTTQRKTTQHRVVRSKKIILWIFLSIMPGAILMPVGGYIHYFSVSAAVAADASNSNSRASFWRAVRSGNEGYTAVSGQETNVFIQNGGQNWRQLRNGLIASVAPWVLGLSLLALIVFYLTRGKIMIEGGANSGQSMQRWTSFERTLHWVTAILFIILSITGFSMFFGRAVLIPLLGAQGFVAVAKLCITLHNYLGPVFVMGVLVEILIWMRFNMPDADDIDWLKQGGGMFTKGRHPHAGRLNAGEKIWFWIICTFGVAVCVSGLILDFPNFGQLRATMQLSNVIHSSCAVIWVAVSFGHIYIGSVGSEGALKGMTTGQVSAEWARQHHDRWYQEEVAKGNMLSEKQRQKRTDEPESAANT